MNNEKYNLDMCTYPNEIFQNLFIKLEYNLQISIKLSKKLNKYSVIRVF